MNTTQNQDPLQDTTRRRSVVGPPLAAAVLVLTMAAALSMGGQIMAPSPDEQRLRMVEEQIERRGIDDPRVLEAMRLVPRHLFVPAGLEDEAYVDHPVPIGHNQTISQPYIVALMTSRLDLDPVDRVLEIGTGSGYQAAVLAQLAAQVYTIEIIPELGQRATKTLRKLGYRNVHVRLGDGYAGWPEEAPFDAILLTAAPPEIPRPLLAQLAVGGTLVAPVGDGIQELQIITRTPQGFSRRYGGPVRFVPMTGQAQMQAETEIDRKSLRPPLPH